MRRRCVRPRFLTSRHSDRYMKKAYRPGIFLIVGIELLALILHDRRLVSPSRGLAWLKRSASAQCWATRTELRRRTPTITGRFAVIPTPRRRPVVESLEQQDRHLSDARTTVSEERHRPWSRPKTVARIPAGLFGDGVLGMDQPDNVTHTGIQPGP